MAASDSIPWRPITPLPAINGAMAPLLKTLDSLHAAWTDALRHASAEEVAEARKKRLRRHAVETGIIGGLYDLDRGTTESLVAAGLANEIANQAGGINEDTLRIIRAQYMALEFLVDLVNKGTDLSASVIRHLHGIIMQHQQTHETHDQSGRAVQAPLHHGEWRRHPNHIFRPDGVLLEYCPPEQVESQIDELVRLYEQAESAHPLVKSAWLHHRFMQIHPFEDGNGRVARALTLFVLLRDEYAPLVVDRRQRESYLTALDAAHEGDLTDLTRLFIQLEINAMQATLPQPVSQTTARDAADVVRAYAKRLNETKEAAAKEKAEAAQDVAKEALTRIRAYLEDQGRSLGDALRDIDPGSWVTTAHAVPPDERSRWWRRQLIQAARTVDFPANLSSGAWWATLHMEACGERLRFLSAVQKVGHGETGVLAVTAFAELVPPESDESKTAIEPEPALNLSPTDSITLTYTDSPSARWEEIENFIREKLREAVERFVDRLG